MERDLDKIIRDRDSYRETIDTGLLLKCTEPVTFRAVMEYGLDRIKKLYIISNAAFLLQSLELRDGTMGCYLNRQYGWLLLIGPDVQERKQVIGRCSAGLECLDIRFSDAEDLEIGHLSALQTLKLWRNDRLRSIRGIEELKQLRTLHIEKCSACADLDVSGLERLETLYVNGITEKIAGLSQAKTLASLILIDAVPGRKLDLNSMASLQRLYVSGDVETVCLDQVLPGLTECRIVRSGLRSADFLRKMPNLQILMLNDCPLDSLPDLCCCPNLFFVDLEKTLLSQVEGLPAEIEDLNLSGTAIRRVPECIRSMEYLYVLNLNDLKLEELPLWLDELLLPVTTRQRQVEKGITLYGTSVSGMDMTMFPEQQEMLRGWLETYHAEAQRGEKPFNEIKVVFLGDGEAGKSLVVHRLMNDGAQPQHFDEDATPGVAIYHRTMKLEDRTVRAHYWDFGGQEILHSMHRIFQTHRTVYVVVLNARNDTQDERAQYWLRCIRSFDGRQHENVRILFVLNKTDQNPRASINMTSLRRLQPGLSDAVMLSAKRDPADQFNKKLGEALEKEIMAMENLRACYPAAWYRVKLRLEQMEKDHINSNEFDRLCDQEGVEQDKSLRDDLQKLLSALGVIFRCKGTWTGKAMLLRPEWVTNAIYKIIFNKHIGIHNGIVPIETLIDCICAENAETAQYRCVSKKMKYEQMDVRYILDVMEKYKLSFPIDSSEVFIPMLCERDESPLLGEYADDISVLEVWWRFEYLPQNLLFVLMVERYEELDKDHVWLDGARFLDNHTGSSAIVCREGNLLKIYVRSEAQRSEVIKYYEDIERNIMKVIDKVFRIQNGVQHVLWKTDTAAAFDRFLVFKADGKRELFDMRRLEEGKNRGISLFYSKILDAALSAEEIQNRAHRDADPMQRMLVRDIVDACGSIQKMRIYWDSKEGSRENSRNSQICIFMGARHYLAFDQTLCGESRGRNQEGELDLEIRKNASTPWTIYEALNMSGANKRYWEEHLDRLLDNYNPHGLKCLFLVSYVCCDKARFREIWQVFEQHIPGYDPGPYTCIPASYADLTEVYVKTANLIKVAQCTYACGGSNTTVYHIFVHLGERQQ